MINFPGFSTLCSVLQFILESVHSVIGSWGWAIVLLAIIIRILLFPITRWGLQQQSKAKADIARLQPAIDEVKGQLSGSEQSEAILKLYKDNGVSLFAPLKGLVGLFLQIPIFLALFVVLDNMVVLEGEKFFWVSDLSRPDHFINWGLNIPYFGSYLNLLPILMAAASVYATLVADDVPRFTIIALALVFLVLFYNFSSALVLYWLTANVAQIVQQRISKT